ncbi:MAG: lantibiotic dehydratase family protein, partial [Dactylosporangium sp.]|nr:lantibiotic dehydratase family protein [Dactylosporangium sp.]
MTAAHGWYRHVDEALVRASMGVADGAPSCWPSAGAGVEAWRAWIGQVWADRGVAEAVSTASPVLAERVQAAIDGKLTDPARVRRLAVSLARYLVRMHGRATPFGLFAGVAAVRFDRPVSGR